MSINFNSNFANFLSTSKVFQKLQGEMHSHPTWPKAEDRDYQKYDLVLVSVMEMLLLTPELQGNCSFFSNNLSQYVLPTNSESVKEYCDKLDATNPDLDGKFVKGLVGMIFTCSEDNPPLFEQYLAESQEYLTNGVAA